MLKVFQKVVVVFLLSTVIISCNQAKEEEVIVPKAKPKLVEFGFNIHDFNIVNDTIKSGDTFGSLLEKQNLNGREVYDIVAKVKDTFDVRSIRKGKPFTILRSKDRTNKIQVFIYQPDKLNFYVIDFRDSIVVHKKAKPLMFKTRTIAGALNGSLSETLQNLKVDPALATRIAKIYAWSIDFFKLKKGDKFALKFTERYINDTIYDGVDSLKASFFEYKGKKVYAFPFAPDANTKKQQYFDEEGKTLKNFFLKAPLKFINITSRYTKNRFHPVQKRWKAHNGTDYAAPTGTPIMSTAAGFVEQAGYTTGNGNFVKVKHDRTYSTQYLHMSKILVRRGQRVTQGQVIGKVGSTGLATGPHVCYRFWKNGVQVDALRLKLPTSTAMDSKYKQKYMEYMNPLKRELDSISEASKK
ncbi:peptidoglycan DD-metalloendopeptidase family protein [Flavobacterium sp. AS60]|uniref:M23 family metallopeptidase n=1 Tax=Flavobacterium anseongense TaxID=2910677 RepID=UPI001F32DD97|nr:peptidoglycan DD-metalloendopeptidase family protein [Flavobacterium sp. AS60]MCF6128614.1 peptidoglycan DD-metalloendopeptidase family protein [Flavobacterium sp. AS60]